MASSCPALINWTEPSEITVPKEIWIHILSFLDFETLQKTCTLVSKTWFDEIRNSTRLSGEMTLKTTWPWWKVKDINQILSQWTKLRVLRMTNERDITQCGINLEVHTLLRKIIIPKEMPLEELGVWGQVKKIWFDPKKFYNQPIDLKNVIDIEIDIQKIPETFAMEQIGKKLPGIEGLIIVGTCWSSNLQELNFKSFKNLRKLEFNIEIDNVNELLLVLNMLEIFLAKTAVKVTGSITIIQDPHGLDEKGTLEIFRRALELINEKFPRKSTELTIEDCWYEFAIKKSPDELHTLVGDPELMGYIEDVFDTVRQFEEQRADEYINIMTGNWWPETD